LTPELDSAFWGYNPSEDGNDVVIPARYTNSIRIEGAAPYRDSFTTTLTAIKSVNWKLEKDSVITDLNSYVTNLLLQN
jgi:hypothetical protein